MAQMVFATVLLIGAGLMVQGFFRLSDVYKTFDPHQVLTMRVSLPEKQFPDDVSRRAFYLQLLQRLSTLPGVQVAGMVANPPASNVDSPTTLFVREGHAVLNASQAPSADIQSASSDFFSALHIAVLDGRAISEQDGAQSPQVAVISRTLARHYWGQDSPIGQKIKLGAPNSTAPWTTIVGVVEDVKQNWWDGVPRPVIYLPYTQAPRRTMEVVVRTSANPLTVAASVRQAMHSLAPDVSAAGLGTMERSIADSLAPLRILGVLMVLFGSVAMALAGLGIYGVLAHSVAQRTQEFGIRMALGAQRADVLRLVIGQSWRLCLAGLGVGLPLAYALARVMSSALYGVIALDLAIFAALAVMLTAVALFAGYMPARRAMRIDPLQALHSE
jgi:putative ABC transport system permease protein